MYIYIYKKHQKKKELRKKIRYIDASHYFIKREKNLWQEGMD